MFFNQKMTTLYKNYSKALSENKKYCVLKLLNIHRKYCFKNLSLKHTITSLLLLY